MARHDLLVFYSRDYVAAAHAFDTTRKASNIAVLDTGQREGRLDDGFFAALMRQLPRRAAQIREIRGRWSAMQDISDPWPRQHHEQAVALR